MPERLPQVWQGDLNLNLSSSKCVRVRHPPVSSRVTSRRNYVINNVTKSTKYLSYDIYPENIRES